nr:DNA methyltransferase [Clostridioides sp.]
MEALNIRSAKRSKNEKTGLHNWHSYYAGYSEAVVEDIIKYFNVNENDIVLDPWIGSGTTAIICQKKGIMVIGRDINPVMVKFSNAKVSKLIDYNLNKYAKDILDYSSSIKNEINISHMLNTHMEEYIKKDDYIQIKFIQTSIDYVIEKLDYDKYSKNILVSFYYSALFQIIRVVGTFKKGSNPTWIKKSEINHNTEFNIQILFTEVVESMVEDLKISYQNIQNKIMPNIEVGDSKKLNLEDNSVNFVITSPPYLTRIDYIVSTKPELLFLGYDENREVDKLRKQTMGAPVVREQMPIIDDKWGDTCIAFLENVKVHNSKAAKSYYFKNFIQYFNDAFQSVEEIARVLCDNGKAAIIVQTSYFKELEIKLSDIYVEMGKNVGLKSKILKRDVVRQHMANVNSKSSEYVTNKIFYEDIILYEKVEV